MNGNKDIKSEKEELDDAGMQNSDSWIGYVFGVAAAISSAFANFFFKITHEDKTKAVLLRMLLQYIILIPFMTIQKIDFVINDLKTNVFILIRGFLSSAVMIFLGYSLDYLPLGDAMAIFYAYPVLVVFFACICLKGIKNDVKYKI